MCCVALHHSTSSLSLLQLVPGGLHGAQFSLQTTVPVQPLRSSAGIFRQIETIPGVSQSSPPLPARIEPFSLAANRDQVVIGLGGFKERIDLRTPLPPLEKSFELKEGEKDKEREIIQENDEDLSSFESKRESTPQRSKQLSQKRVKSSSKAPSPTAFSKKSKKRPALQGSKQAPPKRIETAAKAPSSSSLEDFCPPALTASKVTQQGMLSEKNGRGMHRWKN